MSAKTDLNQKIISMYLDMMEEQRHHMHQVLDEYVDKVISAGRQWTRSVERNQPTFLEIHKIINMGIAFLSLKWDEMEREHLSCLLHGASDCTADDEFTHQQKHGHMVSIVDNVSMSQPVTSHGDSREDDSANFLNTHTCTEPNLQCDQQARYDDLYKQLQNLAAKQDGLDQQISLKIYDLKMEMESLKSDVDQINTDVCNKIDEINADLTDKVDEIKTDTSDKVDKSNTDISNKVDKINTDLSSKINEVSADMHKIEDFNSDLSGCIDKVNADLSDKIQEINLQLSEKVDEMNTDLSNKIDEVNVEMTDKIDEINSEISDKVDKSNTDLSNKVAEINTDLSAKVDQINTDLSAHIDKIDEVNLELSEKVDEINTDLTEKCDQIEVAMSDKIYEIKTDFSYKIDQINADLSRTADQIKVLSQTLSNSEQEHAAQIVALENHLSTIEKDMQDNVKQVEQQLDGAGTNYTMLRELFINRLAPLEKLRDILNDRATSQSENGRQLQAVMSELKGLSGVVETCVKRLEVGVVGFKAEAGYDIFDTSRHIVRSYQSTRLISGCLFDSSTGIFTATVAGIYLAYINLQISRNGIITIYLMHKDKSQDDTTEICLAKAEIKNSPVFNTEMLEMKEGDELFIMIAQSMTVKAWWDITSNIHFSCLRIG